jgi:hypothetical protein
MAALWLSKKFTKDSEAVEITFEEPDDPENYVKYVTNEELSREVSGFLIDLAKEYKAMKQNSLSKIALKLASEIKRRNEETILN